MIIVDEAIRSISNYQGKEWLTTTASHGVANGKVFYEITVEQSGAPGGLCRVGWGSADCFQHLGYDRESFGYGGTAKKSNGATFVSYGEKFGSFDVIGCSVNLDCGHVSFFKNGKSLGVAFRICRTTEPLFPK
jgi:ATP-dependent RNA helicase DDX1